MSRPSQTGQARPGTRRKPAPDAPPTGEGVLQRLIREVMALRREALDVEEAHADDVAAVEPDQRASARNLLHYLAVRQHDLRPVQRDLSRLGLSSLGRLEAHAMASLNAVLQALHGLAGESVPDAPEPPADFDSGPALLREHAAQLLGPPPRNRSVRIMVTMPSEAATDYVLVRDLLEAGMDVMRINCAHDDAQAWALMVRNMRRAERETGRPCRILCDLGGPKLRTGAMEQTFEVLRWRPERDSRGVVLRAARVWVTSAEAPAAAPIATAPVLPLAPSLMISAREGDLLEVLDTSGRVRSLRLAAAAPGGFWGESRKSAYIESAAPARLLRGETEVAIGKVGTLPATEEPIILHVGDRLLLTREAVLGRPARRDSDGTLLHPASIPCTLPEVFRDAHPRERVYFDDGKIAGVIRRVEPELVEVEITHASPKGSRLSSDKGINLPDTELHLPGLTPKDMQDLDFAARNADIVGLSFIRKAEDVLRLEEELARRRASHVGILLKIETRRAMEGLGRLLLAGLCSPPVGVMVARGDLAVELGFERLAEAQEEILWLCEAAHVPVIWATQVLETMARTGMPSRAEVTDAAMSGRAECVMLNKGPYIVETVLFLKSILQRMQNHQEKKRSMLRRLSVSEVE